MYKEQWKNIEGYEGLYQVSNYGRVRSLDRYVKHSKGGQKLLKGKEVKTRINKTTGYIEVGLSKDGKQTYHTIHRLIARAFIPNPNNLPVINHIDGCKINNSIDNLEWCTQQYNIQHSFNTGLSKNNMTQEISSLGNKAHRRKVRCIEDDIIFDSVKDAANYCGVDSARITVVCKGRRKTVKGKHFEYVEGGVN